jgi:hypothetical protein
LAIINIKIMVTQCPVFLTEETEVYPQRTGNLNLPCDKYLVYSEDYMDRRWIAV